MTIRWNLKAFGRGVFGNCGTAVPGSIDPLFIPYSVHITNKVAGWNAPGFLDPSEITVTVPTDDRS